MNIMISSTLSFQIEIIFLTLNFTLLYSTELINLKLPHITWNIYIQRDANSKVCA